MKKIRIGVVGAGYIVTHKHLPAFKKVGYAEVSAVCDLRKAAAESVARKFGVKRYFNGLSEMLKEELDVVDICTPIQTHAPLAIEAMEAGCNVLVEKPMAMSVQEVDRMYRASEKNHVSLCVVHQNIFNPAVRRAWRLFEEGVVGDLIRVDVGTFVTRDYHVCLDKNHWSHRLPGGFFFETLPHPVYLLQLFLNNKIEPMCVMAEKSQLPWMKADVVKVLIRGEGGLGSLEASCNSPYHGDSLNVLGTKMGLQVDLWARSIIKYGRRTEDPFSIGKSNLKIATQSFGLVGTTVKNALKMAIGGVKVSAHYEFIRKFLRSILNGEEPPVSRAEARENVRVVESICKAVDNIFDSAG